MFFESLLDVGGSGVGNKAGPNGNAHNERGEGKSAYSQVPATLFVERY
jgi:hypothetical protein